MNGFYPGVFTQEVEFGGASSPIVGVDMSIAGCIGYFKKGPIGKAIKCTSLEQIEEIFGGFYSKGLAYYSLKGFYENEGGTVYVTRTAHYTDVNDKSTLTAVKSSVTNKDLANANGYKITASSEGVWGDEIDVAFYDDIKLDTTVKTSAVIGAVEIELTSVSGAYEGQPLKIGASIHTVKSVDYATKKLTLNEPLTVAQNAAVVVKSLEFGVKVYVGDVIEENFSNLVSYTNGDREATSIINDENTGSKFIRIAQLSTGTDGDTNRPAIGTVALAGGNDGLADVAISDIYGSSTAKTGLHAFDAVSDSLNIFCPESCDAILGKKILEYCMSRLDAFALLSIPYGYSSASALTYRKETGNFNSSYGALYYKWGSVDDPLGKGTNPQKSIPIVGHLAGYIARHDRIYGLHESPAGEQAILKGINSLESEIDTSDLESLNDNSINCIRNIQGLGIVVWGTRTLSTDVKWRYIHARRIFMYAQKSIALGTRWAVFKRSNPTTWRAIIRACTAFLNTLQGLKGESAKEKYIVICDETTNTSAVMLEGKIVTQIGLNIESIGEVVLFKIGQMKDGVSISS